MKLARFQIIGLVIAMVFAIYMLGSKPDWKEPSIQEPNFGFTPHFFEDSLIKVENTFNIKPDNEARIFWADSSKAQSEYVVLYLSGFTATHAEGLPVHQNIAKQLGANLYIPRMFSHGLDVAEPMLDFDAKLYLEKAKNDLFAAKVLGKKVILMGTSTGATAALWLAAHFPDGVEALVLYSPNIRIANPLTTLLNIPWGLQIARLVQGGNYVEYQADSIRQNYWYTKYRLESTVLLQEILERTMIKATFAKVNQPVFMGYYYKNEEEQDKVVSVPKMLEMFEELSTPNELKRKVAFDDAGHHVIASKINNKNWKRVEEETMVFLKEVLDL